MRTARFWQISDDHTDVLLVGFSPTVHTKQNFCHDVFDSRSYKKITSNEPRKIDLVNVVLAEKSIKRKARQYTREVLKRTKSLIVPKPSPTQALGLAAVAEE